MAAEGTRGQVGALPPHINAPAMEGVAALQLFECLTLDHIQTDGARPVATRADATPALNSESHNTAVAKSLRLVG